MAEKALTVKGLRAEQKKLQDAYGKADEAYHKALAKHKKAKIALVDFQNSYGRVLEVLDASEE